MDNVAFENHWLKVIIFTKALGRLLGLFSWQIPFSISSRKMTTYAFNEPLSSNKPLSYLMLSSTEAFLSMFVMGFRPIDTRLDSLPNRISSVLTHTTSV